MPARNRLLSSAATLSTLILSILALSLTACSSPNRGIWKGEFSGSVSGTVEFRINARGSKLSGEIDGLTEGGQPFQAEMEGKIRDRFFYATFEGLSRASMLPLPFEGFMEGELGEGLGNGEWTATLKANPVEMKGEWAVEQELP